MEDFRVKYIRSLNNILSELEDNINEKDRSNLYQAIGYIYSEIASDGKMTKDLAIELDCECLYKEVRE